MQQIPKYHETFVPILQVLSDGKTVHYKKMREKVVEQFYADLPQDLLHQRVKNGELLILNRISWGKVYLKQAGMLTQPERAMVQITEKGREVLAQGSLTLDDIKADKDFIANSNKQKETSKGAATLAQDDASPQDMIDAGIQAIDGSTKADLLERLKGVNPYDFEVIVNDLFEKMGYGGAQTTVKSGDGGIDGVIDSDELGLEKIYIQAKRFESKPVREPDIRNFIGAMSRDAQKGIFVTTSSFDEKAIAKAHDATHKIVLVDGDKLVDLMYKHGVGVQRAKTYELKELDEDYFN